VINSRHAWIQDSVFEDQETKTENQDSSSNEVPVTDYSKIQERSSRRPKVKK